MEGMNKLISIKSMNFRHVRCQAKRKRSYTMSVVIDRHSIVISIWSMVENFDPCTTRQVARCLMISSFFLLLLIIIIIIISFCRTIYLVNISKLLLYQIENKNPLFGLRNVFIWYWIEILLKLTYISKGHTTVTTCTAIKPPCF